MPSQFNAVVPNGENLLVMNARTGGILSLTGEYATDYRSFERGCAIRHGDLQQGLSCGGMIVDADRNEYQEVLAESLVARFDSTSLYLTIAPTMACNFHCPYCYEGASHSGSPMSTRTIDALATFVGDHYPGISSLHVTWYGGEPLLYPSLIEKITEELIHTLPAGCTYDAGVVTNGYLLTENVTDRLASCAVRNAQVTLDGSKDSHNARRFHTQGEDSYSRILDNITYACNVLDVTIRANIDSTNMSDAYALLDELIRRDLSNKVDFYLAPVDFTDDDYPHACRCLDAQEFAEAESNFFLEAVRRDFKVDLSGRAMGTNICGAVMLNSYVVDPDGFLYKCWNDVGVKSQAIGSVFDRPSIGTPESKWLTYMPSQEKCGDCFAFPLCMGGCPRSALKLGINRCASIKSSVTRRLQLAAQMAEAEKCNEGDD